MSAGLSIDRGSCGGRVLFERPCGNGNKKQMFYQVMTDSIIEKIANHLEKGIETEADCVYLLSQIRKFIEQQEIKDFWNLRMCANWALHCTLDNERNKTVNAFFEEVNNFLIDAESNGCDLHRHPSLKNKLMFFTGLQNELKGFLNFIGVSTVICDEPEKLANLISIFNRVIEDTPLICKPNKLLSHFSELNFSQRKATIDYEQFSPTLYWTIKKNNNTTLRINIDNRTVDFGFAEIDIRNFTYIESKSD